MTAEIQNIGEIETSGKDRLAAVVSSVQRLFPGGVLVVEKIHGRLRSDTTQGHEIKAVCEGNPAKIIEQEHPDVGIVAPKDFLLGDYTDQVAVFVNPHDLTYIPSLKERKTVLHRAKDFGTALLVFLGTLEPAKMTNVYMENQHGRAKAKFIDKLRDHSEILQLGGEEAEEGRIVMSVRLHQEKTGLPRYTVKDGLGGEIVLTWSEIRKIFATCDLDIEEVTFGMGYNTKLTRLIGAGEALFVTTLGSQKNVDSIIQWLSAKVVPIAHPIIERAQSLRKKHTTETKISMYTPRQIDEIVESGKLVQDRVIIVAKRASTN